MHTLLLETIDEAAHSELEQQSTTTLAATPDADLGDEDLTDVEAIITRGRGQVTSQLLARCPNLRVIGRCGVGLDNVDVAAATAAGVAVINAPGSPAITTAEHTIMLMLALTRRLYPQVAAVKSDDWAVRARVDADECAGKTLGVVGLGAIGRRVAEVSTVLGMEVDRLQSHDARRHRGWDIGAPASLRRVAGGIGHRQPSRRILRRRPRGSSDAPSWRR